MLNYPLTISRGITFGPITIVCKDASGNPIDLTGYIPFAQVRANPDAADVVLDLQPSITSASAGAVTIPAIQDEQTKNMTEGVFRWDFILQKPTGERIGPFVGGFFKIKAINTQPA